MMLNYIIHQLIIVIFLSLVTTKKLPQFFTYPPSFRSYLLKIFCFCSKSKNCGTKSFYSFSSFNICIITYESSNSSKNRKVSKKSISTKFFSFSYSLIIYFYRFMYILLTNLSISQRVDVLI